MTFRQLEIFIAVANRRNLKAAAQALHISQPSVSEQLGLLQDELGRQLHRKMRSGIELTPAGTLLLKEAKIITAQIKNLRVNFAAEGVASVAPTLSIGGCYSATNHLLPSLLSSFKKQHSDVELNLCAGSRSELQRMVLDGHVDLAVIHELPTSAKLGAKFLGTDPVVAFVATDHPLARKERVDWSDIQRFGFVVTGTTTGPGIIIKRYRESLAGRKATIKVVMRCNSPDAAKNAVAQNMAIGLLFKRSIESDIHRGEFKNIVLPGEKVDGKRYLIFHKKRPLSPHAREFSQMLRSAKTSLR